MKYSFALYFFLFSLLAFIVTGCDSSEADSVEGDAGSLIPLAEGNTWTMTVDGSFVPDDETLTLRVGGEETISGESYRQVTYSFSSGGIIDNRFVVRVIERGLYLGRVITNPDEGPPIHGFELRSSVSDGDSYTHTDETSRTYIVSISEQTITVPAGTYDVLVYRIVPESGGMADVVFLAPGVGPVQLDFRGETYRLESTNVE